MSITRFRLGVPDIAYIGAERYCEGCVIPSSSTELVRGIVLTGGIFLVYSTVGQVRPVNSNQPAGIYVSACSIGVGEICTSPVARQLRRHENLCAKIRRREERRVAERGHGAAEEHKAQLSRKGNCKPNECHIRCQHLSTNLPRAHRLGK